MEHTVYILFSTTKNKYYIGYSANIQERVIRHNQKSKGFTGAVAVTDWKLMYTEKFVSKTEALAREKQIKSWKSRIKIEALIKKSNSYYKSAGSEHSDFI